MTAEEFERLYFIDELAPNSFIDSEPFTCGVDDLDEFFTKDSFLNQNKLLGKTYLFRSKETPTTIVAAITLSNDSIRLNNKIKSEDVTVFLDDTELSEKRLKRYPGVLIGRLAINIQYAGQGIGTEVMNFVKYWFRNGNKTGCRFLIVDALNTPSTLRYYEKNGFRYLISDERSEAKYMEIGMGRLPLHTRLMYFDLLHL